MPLRHRAFALVIVMVAVAAIFALAIQGGASLRASIVETTALREQAQLEFEARSAATIALMALTTSPQAAEAIEEAVVVPAGGASPQEVDEPEPVEAPEIPELPPEIKRLLEGMLDEAQDDDDAKRVSPPGGIVLHRQKSNGALGVLNAVGLPVAPVEVQVGERRWLVQCIDGAGLLNLNLASEDALVRFFEAEGCAPVLAERLAHQVIDWRDKDSFRKPNGAEREDYTRRGVLIRNGAFAAVEELLYLPAMTRPLFERVATSVTVAGDGVVHAGTAPRSVLLSVEGMTPPGVERLLAARAEAPLTDAAIREALGIASREAIKGLRLEATSYVRLRIGPADGSWAPFVAEAIVSNRGGVDAIHVRPWRGSGVPISPGAPGTSG